MSMRIEHHGPSGRTELETEGDILDVLSWIGELEDERNVAIRLERTSEARLLIRCSAGRYAVRMERRSGSYDLVGDPTRTGVVDFVEGPHPARHIVSRTEAETVVTEFLRGGSSAELDARWE